MNITPLFRRPQLAADTDKPKAYSTIARGLQLPAGEGGTSASMVARWDKHRALLNHDLPKTRDNAWEELAKLDREMAETPLRRWREGAIAETVALATNRGEEVEPVKPDQKTRILSRGGLDAARRAGYLDSIGDWKTEEVWAIAQMYQDCFERVQGQGTPDRSGGGGRGRGGPQYALLNCGEALITLRGNQTIGQIMALDLICGFDVSIAQVAMITQRRRETISGRLREGLSNATFNWHGRRKPDKTDAERAAELALKHDAIMAAQRSVA
jgi:hypothetical protein